LIRELRFQRRDELARALGIGRRGVVAFAGAGGKTACIRRLLGERPQALATTTTHLAPSGFATGLLLAARDERLLERLERRAAGVRPLVLALGGGAKLRSPSLDWHVRFLARHAADLVFVEADGARRRLVKLPAAHEPAWPPAELASAVVVVGAAALAEPLERGAHRPERFGGGRRRAIRLADLEKMVRAYACAAPPSAPLVFVVTGCGADELPLASALARAALAAVRARDPHAQDPAVPLGVVATPDVVSGPFWVWRAPEVRRRSKVAIPGACGIVLAAGRGARFDADGATSKLLSTWRGRTLVERAVETWGRSGFAALCIVSGHAAAQIEPRMRRALDRAGAVAAIVRNPRPGRGLGSSVRLSTRASPAGLGLLYGHADMPGLRVPTLRRIAGLGTTLRRAIVQPTVRGRPVNPVFFPADLRSALSRVLDAQGGRPVLEAHRDRVVLLPVDDVADEFADVDVRSDLERLRRRAVRRRPAR